ncbi:hypothetical protein ALC57_00365 [Trachymyrmex cornetzi]|uniref:Uncharacterized protein n=1 Tax=Trachymyrmex cornetzi TaxID=471704 RepID=A0A151JS40_9HYME|nr:hypothetical protein ALC57_00365 [Trachymyrmex cornetzi]
MHVKALDTEWEEHIRQAGLSEVPRMEELFEFLTGKYHMLEMVEKEKSTSETHKHNEKKREKSIALASTAGQECEYCKGGHRIYSCDKLLKLPIVSRISEIKQLILCLNCLRKGHWNKECRSSGCKICKAKHNSLLHIEKKEGANQEDSSGTAITTHCTKDWQQVLLSTARVYVFDINGRQHSCRVLLDPGSQSNLVTKALVDKLHLSSSVVNVPISGINQNKIHISQSITLVIQSRYNNKRFELNCLVLQKITECIPQTRMDTTRLKIPDCLKLADEEYYKPGVIEVLIGADTFWQILQDDHIDLLPGQPRIQSTSLGWILGGRLENKIDGGRIACNLLTNEELSQQLERFWQPEEVNGPEYHSQEEQLCENHFKTHVQRNSDGRFIVALPRRDDIILGDSYKTALKRLLALER